MRCNRLTAALAVLLLGLATLVSAQPGAPTNVSVYARAATSGYVTHGMTIPPGPILWHDAARLSAAQARYAASPSTYALWSPATGTAARVLQQAFQARMTGTCTAFNGFTVESQIDSCGDAIAWLMNTTDIGAGRRNEFSYPGGAACSTADYRGANPDYARWYGEIALLAYNDLRPYLTDGQRREALGCFARRVMANFTDDWGAGPDTGNNYNWGFIRNGLLFAFIMAGQESASTYDPPATNCNGWTVGAGATAKDICNDDFDTVIDEVLDEAIDVRWDTHLKPYLNGPAKGGIASEGDNYGHYLFDYMGTTVLIAMRDYGRDLTTETDYWAQAAVAVAVATSNRPLYGVQASVGPQTQPYYTTPTYGNTQGVYGMAWVGESEKGNFMTTIAVLLDGTAVGDRVRYWLTTINPRVFGHLKVLDAERGAAGTNLSAWPLDYCGEGFSFCYLRDTWATTGNPTMFFLEIGAVYNTGGNHPDCSAGSWQAWRGQRWVSKEASAAFSRGMTNLSGTAATNTGQNFFHNGAIVADSGSNGFCVSGGDAQYESAMPVVGRLQSASGFFFAAADYTAHWTAAAGSGGRNLTAWANMVSAGRDFVYVRHLNVLVTLDRIEKDASGTITNAFVHFPETPSQSTNVFTGVNNGQELKATILADDLANSTVTYTIRDESSNIGAPMTTSGCTGAGPWVDCDPQHRLEVRLTGAAQSYIPICAQAYTTGDATATCTVTEDGDSIDVSVTQDGSDSVLIEFAKGMTSTGGQITIGATTTAFASSKATMTVNASTVSW